MRFRPGSSRRGRAPSGLVELLRVLAVVFFAALGYTGGRTASDHSSGHLLGPLGGVSVGILLGCAVGYVVGGIFARTAASTADRTEAALRDVSADTLIAGGFGAISGAITAAAFGWPLFFVPVLPIAASIFGVVIVLLSYVGFRVGAAKRDGVLAVISGRTGVDPRRQAGSALHKLIDTSVAIDGRIVDVVRAGFVHGRFIVMRPVLGELTRLADSPEVFRRARGRRGLEVLETLQREPFVDLEVVDDLAPDVEAVDDKLVRAGLEHGYSLMTLDAPLARRAAVSGVQVLNLHALSLALRPPVVVGEDVEVQLIKPGRESGQAVGYLDDGTMVVVERSRSMIGKDVTARVTSVVVTANGRLVFGTLSSGAAAAAKTGA